jgi:hypothetical protein
MHTSVEAFMSVRSRLHEIDVMAARSRRPHIRSPPHVERPFDGLVKDPRRNVVHAPAKQERGGDRDQNENDHPARSTRAHFGSFRKFRQPEPVV